MAPQEVTFIHIPVTLICGVIFFFLFGLIYSVFFQFSQIKATLWLISNLHKIY